MNMTNKAQEAISEAVKHKHPISNLEQVGIGQRMINLLHDNKIYDMEDLMNKRREDLLSIPNFGERQLEKLMSALAMYDTVED